MAFVTTDDGAEIYFKDWGSHNAQPIFFHHGWPLSSDDWHAQMRNGQTITDGTVTFRDRDSCRQWRVSSNNVVAAVRDILEGGAIPSSVETTEAAPESS